MENQRLAVEGVTVKAGNKTVVNNVSFTVRKGETVVLIGESGCGKTVASAAVMGLLPSSLRMTAGRIIGGGRSRVGVVMQNPASCFDPVFTIKEHFTETFKAAGIKSPGKDILENIIGSVGLDASEVLGAYPFQLSGGMLQRLMIAIAAAMDALFIIADEPSSDLDVLGQKEVMALISKIKKEKGFGMLFITHDLALASSAADYIMVMKDGAIIERGEPGVILKNPSTAYAKALVKANAALYDTPWINFLRPLPNQAKDECLP